MDERVDVLIVDDERINLKLLEGVLRVFDLNIVTVSSGREALSLMSSHDFALVLLDVMMPEMDGFTVAERIRENDNTRNIPIIFVTAISKEQRHVFRGYELGAVDYLFKPVEPNILKSKVNTFVELHRKRRGLEEATKRLETMVEELQISKRALEESERRYRTVADYNYDWESWYSSDGNPLYISPSCERISGYPPEKFMNDPDFLEQTIHRDDLELWRKFNTGSDPETDESLDFRIFNKNNRMRWLSLVRRPVSDEKGHPLGVRTSMRDITSRKLIENRVEHQALHDPLTGLANRTLLLDRVRQAMARAQRLHKYFAIVFMGLDRFKVINDSMGHSFGDKLLVTIGGRLRENVRRQDTVSRFGGDEFVVLLEELDSVDQAKHIVESISDITKEPLNIDGREVRITASIGLDVARDDQQEPHDRIQNAHIAMYNAKEGGKDRVSIFNHKMRDKAVKEMTIENELRRALDENQFEMYYQPIFDLGTMKLFGFESLVRWNHPERGMVGPGEFIHIAEETGLIVDLGRWVLEDATNTMRRWQDELPQAKGLSIAVNISAKQFRKASLVDSVRSILEKTGLPPECLKLEITETVVMVDASDSVLKLDMLKDLGVILSIDDFGTGYSSMSYLQKFSIDQLKVDLSFVQRLDVDPESIEIVRAIINLAHGLSLRVVAEGIENRQQLNLLYSLQCDYGQGYLVSRPLPVAQAEEFIRNKSVVTL
ncbi:two-component system response regulator [Salidesulfovibrio onnuriiensis]|uniref:two-component system response regulator n=1 Tax=Salidesulfovibrio onnuriiensis TaxID=2583823 RepID=UPI0011CA5BF0|nr:EAL domain-containing protein [Salidesulfovibrio onnuriiensis]